MHLNVQHIACINTNTFLINKKVMWFTNFKVTPVGGVTDINNVEKTQRQSLMGKSYN